MSDAVTETLSILLRRNAAVETDEEAPSCASGNGYDGHMALRISAVFVILVLSSFGALFPVIAKNVPSLHIPSWAFFFAKYFGSGVIVATAFIHLLTPASQALTNPCLTGVITEYPWTEAIALIAVFALFFVELLAMRYATFTSLTGTIEKDQGLASSSPSSSATTGKRAAHGHGHGHDHSHSHDQVHSHSHELEPHLSHVPDHTDPESGGPSSTEPYAAQLTSLFILEFGVIFHSIFIGLTLAVSGPEFKTLYIVLVFHQMFEGLGLGSRLAIVPWPTSKRWTPYIMAQAYGLSTPIAIAIGLALRRTYLAESATTLVVNGVFDAISAGILLYTGLVELMAHEFLFSHSLRNASAVTMFGAFTCMVLGATLMALLGKWA